MNDLFLDMTKQLLAQRDLDDYEVITLGDSQRRLSIRFKGKEVALTIPAANDCTNEAIDSLVFQQRLERHIAVIQSPAKSAPKVFPSDHSIRRYAERVLHIPLKAETDAEAIRELASMGVNVGLLSDTMAKKLERACTGIRSTGSRFSSYLIKGGDGYRYMMAGATVVTVLPKSSGSKKKARHHSNDNFVTMLALLPARYLRAANND